MQDIFHPHILIIVIVHTHLSLKKIAGHYVRVLDEIVPIAQTNGTLQSPHISES